MPLAAGIFRRGAIYYWRKRIPGGFAKGGGELCVSLGTSDPNVARALSARLAAVFEDLRYRGRGNSMLGVSNYPKEALIQLFAAARDKHAMKLELYGAIQARKPVNDPSTDVADHSAMGWYYRFLSKYGEGRVLAAADLDLMRADGLSELEIARVVAMVASDEFRQETMPSVYKIEGFLRDQGIEPNATIIDWARPAYLRGMSEALLECRPGRSGAPIPFEDLYAEYSDRQNGAQGNSKQATEPAARSQSHASAPSGKIQTLASTAIRPMIEVLVENRAADAKLAKSTARHIKSSCLLFARFLESEHGINAFEDIRQTHLAAFDTLLRKLWPSFGKGGEDNQLSFTEIRKRAAERKGGSPGLSPGTRNRYWTYVNKLLKLARSRGVTLSSDLDVSLLRAPRDKRAREKRPPPPLGNVAEFFRSPVFAGCLDWEKPWMPGGEVFHRAAYFAPMMYFYMGLRREEAAGLEVSDVIFDAPIPFIKIRFNGQRDLKTDNSARDLILHPELVRLGFRQYVETIKSLGYARVFPELHSTTSEAPTGDRLYKEFGPLLKQHRLTLHGLRKLFGDTLRQNSVHEEDRADLIGHGAPSVTSEHYANALALAKQAEFLKTIPILTAHLEPLPIRIVDWVAKKQLAPWSHAVTRRHSVMAKRRTKKRRH